MIQVGRLRRRVDLESPSTTADGYGGQTNSWTTEASNVPAAIWPVGATEMLKNGQQGMIMTHRVRIRYKSSLKANWRIKYQSRYFNIVNIVDQNMDNRFYDLLCKEAET